MTPVWRGECGSRGSRLVTSALGRLGQDTPGRHHDRTAGAISLDWDFEARVMPASDAMEGRSVGFRVKMRCDALRLSNHRDGRSEQVLGSRVAQAERWRSVADRKCRGGTPRGERAPMGARRAVRHGGYGTAPFGVPLSFFLFVARIERSEIRKQTLKLHRRPRITLRSIRATSAHDRDGSGPTSGVV